MNLGVRIVELDTHFFDVSSLLVLAVSSALQQALDGQPCSKPTSKLNGFHVQGNLCEYIMKLVAWSSASDAFSIIHVEHSCHTGDLVC